MRTLRPTLALAAVLGLVASLALAGMVMAAETTLTATLAGSAEPMRMAAAPPPWSSTPRPGRRAGR